MSPTLTENDGAAGFDSGTCKTVIGQKALDCNMHNLASTHLKNAKISLKGHCFETVVTAHNASTVVRVYHVHTARNDTDLVVF